MKWRIIALLMAWPVLILACSAEDEADVIHDLIRKSAQMAEAHQVGDLMRQTGDGFVAMPGNRNADAVKGILFVTFKQYRQFKIHYPKPGVDIGPDGVQATAKIYFLIVRQNQPLPGLKELYEHPRRWIEAAGEKADLYQLKLNLAKKKSSWLVTRAHLEGFKGIGF